MAAKITLGLRAVEALFAATNLGLSAYVTNYYNMYTFRSAPSSISFLVFAQIFSLIAIVYLEVAPRKVPKASHPFASLAVEAANAIFYFCGFIAWAVFLSRLSFCNSTICGVARAVAVFAALEFAAWTATTALLAKDIFKGGLRGSPSASPAPAPATAAPSEPKSEV